jgi:ADP-ribosyl-[dinitrogen reductase] hydrolase
VPDLDTVRSVFRGCLLGGAVGDALGGGIEFLSLAQIRRQFGPDGVTGYVSAYGRTGAITDDTQLTLFTAEGLIRAALAADDESPAGAPAAIWRAYQRWLVTQDSGAAANGPARPAADGWLLGQEFLHHQRSPGMTCLSALRAGRPGTCRNPPNASKGCGGVMRVAPVGLVAADPFELGCQAAALTHGHPSGYLAAGAFALLVSEAADGRGLPGATDLAIRRLRRAEGSGEVAAALGRSVRLAAERPGDPSALALLGEGWVAEEALAIAVYCALSAPDTGSGPAFRAAVLLAANHDGDSDSTAAICGNLLGAAAGAGIIDADLLSRLEGRDVIERVADDLCDVFVAGTQPAGHRYPPG